MTTDAPAEATSPRAVGRPAARRRAVVVVASVTVVVLVVAALVLGPGGGDEGGGGATPPASAPDPLESRILGELDGFLGWLDEHGVAGTLGEVSWPNDDPDGRWGALGRRWLERAAAADVPVAYWAAGEVWDQDDVPYLAYAASGGAGTPVDTVLGPGRVLAGAAEPGLNAAGGSYNACSRQPTCDWFHNRKRGRLGVEWRFDSQATFDFYAAQSITWVRVPIRWERLQPDLGGPLDAEVVDALAATLDRARAAGLGAVVDLHNFGAYYEFDGRTGVRRALGDDLDAGDLADVWRRLLERLGGHEAVVGWGIMNEPVDMGDDGRRRWEEISRHVVGVLRDAGDRTTVLVGGYELSNVHSWPHDEPWIDDPLGLVRYEAHHHWDGHHGAAYEATYAEEARLAEADD